MISKHSKSTLRKTRTKLRKPKFLSLRLQLTATTPPPMTSPSDHKQLINLFPLHPENLVEQDKIDIDEHHILSSCNIFSSCDKASTTLTGILSPSSDDNNTDDGDDVNTNKPSPSSVNYADEEVELVRTAMRGTKNESRNNYDDEEKWVCYSEVVERKKEMTSSSSSTTSCYDNNNNRTKLALKLDYEKIMSTWVNKGPLYINGNSGPDDPLPQTVPDLHDDDFFFPSSVNGIRHDEQDHRGGSGGSWTVPEMTHVESNGVSIGDDHVLHPSESAAMIYNREASVQRYKEKRRNRLFTKTIRYEVRKLNAEKRPRIKGRFVKRN